MTVVELLVALLEHAKPTKTQATFLDYQRWCTGFANECRVSPEWTNQYSVRTGRHPTVLLRIPGKARMRNAHRRSNGGLLNEQFRRAR